jgi:hypothetical protein
MLKVADPSRGTVLLTPDLQEDLPAGHITAQQGVHYTTSSAQIHSKPLGLSNNRSVEKSVICESRDQEPVMQKGT